MPVKLQWHAVGVSPVAPHFIWKLGDLLIRCLNWHHCDDLDEPETWEGIFLSRV